MTVKTDVDRAAFNFLPSTARTFPGVVVEKKFLRDYPHDELGAQLFGTLRRDLAGRAQAQELPRRDAGHADRQGRHRGDLRPLPARHRRRDAGQVNALGTRDDTRRITRVEPIQGQQLRLSLDLGLQRAANDALRRAIAAATRNGAARRRVRRDGPAQRRGARARLLPELRREPVRQADRRRSLRASSTPRRTARRCSTARSPAAYPTGSTFKLVTAIAALADGHDHAEHAAQRRRRVPLRRPRVQERGRRRLRRARAAARAQVSSDVFFYQLGARLNDATGRCCRSGRASSASGTGPGSTCPGEFGGLVPDRKWRDSGLREYERCRKKAKLPYQSQAALFACGGIDRAWSGGDNVNLAVGQGDLQATPLQMAVAYAAIANGGTVVTPHLGLQVEDGDGRSSSRSASRRGAALDISEPTRATILRRPAAARRPGRAAPRPTCSRLPAIPVYGKTGTAERGVDADQSWYACYRRRPGQARSSSPRPSRSGGFGAEAAAPAARLILSQWFGVKDDDVHVGERHASVQPARSMSRVSTATRSSPASEPPPPLVPREWRLRLDPLLLLATLGLVACSLPRDQRRDARRHRRRPALLRRAPGGLRRRRARADVRASRGSTTRACASSSTRSTALLIGSILLVLRRSARATRGSKRWIETAVLPLPALRAGQGAARLALSGFVVDRLRGAGRARDDGAGDAARRSCRRCS